MKPKILIALVVTVLIAAAAVVFVLQKPSSNGPVRVPIPRPDGEIADTSPSGLYQIRVQGTSLSIETKDGKSTFQGIPIPAPENVQDSRTITLTPGLEGDLTAEFSCLFEPQPGRELRAYIRQIRGDEIKRTRLARTGSIERLRIPFQLEKGDTLEFFLRNAAFGFISDLVFYEPAPDLPRKNYVFIIAADTLRRDRVGVYSGQDCSPNIDRFARDAAIFTQAYSTSSWTTPAFMSLFTGLFPNNHSVNYGNVPLDQETATLFEALQERFVTFALNGDHLVSSNFGFNRGFDVYAENYEDAVANDASHRLFSEAADLVRAAQNDSALFFLHTYQVHSPYNPETELANQYFGVDSGGPYRFDPLRFVRFGRELYKAVRPEEIQEIEAVYDAACYTFDFRFGEFVAFLKESGIYEDATIVFLSDHGDEFLDHGAWEHGHSLYNELIHIPLLIKLPGSRSAGARIDEVVSIVDVLPTIMDLQGIPSGKQPAVDGISLLDVIEGGHTPGRIVSAYLAPRALRNGIPARISLISGTHKFIFNQKMTEEDLAVFLIKPPDFTDELYDLMKDPRERSNIIDTQPKIAVSFMRHIRCLEFKKGTKGFLEQLSERLKSLGYF